MIDPSELILEDPNDPDNYRFIDFGHVKGWLPYTEEDKAQRVLDQQMFAQMAVDNAWKALRVERDRLLVESDVYVLPDRWSSYTAEQQAAWASYRQALRDVPQNTTDPNNPTWPVKPT